MSSQSNPALFEVPDSDIISTDIPKYIITDHEVIDWEELPDQEQMSDQATYQWNNSPEQKKLAEVNSQFQTGIQWQSMERQQLWLDEPVSDLMEIDMQQYGQASDDVEMVQYDTDEQQHKCMIFGSILQKYGYIHVNSSVHDAKVKSILEELEVMYIPKPHTNNLSIWNIFLGPDKDALASKNKLQRYILKAKKQILVCSYNIANGVIDRDIAEKLQKRVGTGFKIITDQGQMNMKNIKKYNDVLFSLGIDIKFNVIAKNLMHWKFIVIDDKYLIEGSMNLGNKSLENYEHVTITEDK